MSNEAKFDALKKLNLPVDQYVIMGSGPLGVRNLRLIHDIDIFVTDTLWNRLIKQYGITELEEKRVVILQEGFIETLHEGSFYKQEPDPTAPSIETRIQEADRIDGLPFDSLQNTLYFKRKWSREKDLIDIKLIEEFLCKSGK